MRYSLWVELHGKINGEALGDKQKVQMWLKPPPQKEPFLPNLTCMNTQGSVCGFDCNPICTHADLELGLAMMPLSDFVNSLAWIRSLITIFQSSTPQN